MTKSLKKQFVSLLIIALLGFAGLVAGLDFAFQNQQRINLKQDMTTYLSADFTPKKLSTWEYINHIHLTSLNDQNTDFARALQNGIRRNLNGYDYFFTENIKGKPYLFWQVSHRTQKIAMSTPLFLMRDHPSLFSLIFTIYTLIVGILIYVYLSYRMRVQRNLEIVEKNLQRIMNREPIRPILWTSNQPLYRISDEIKTLSKKYDHLATKFDLRQTSFIELIDHLPIGVMLIKDSGDVILHNHAMSELLNQSISENEHNFVDDVKSYNLARMIEHTHKTHKARHQRIKLFQPGGAEKYVDANVIEIFSNNHDSQILVILSDLSEAEHLQQMQYDFVHNVSHELKTPVTAIKGFAETLLAGALSDPKTAKDFTEIILEESNKLELLVKDILVLARSGKIVHHDQKVDIEHLIKDLLKNLRPAIAEKNISVETKISSNLVVTIDESILETILTNLLTNAIDYNRDHGKILIEARLKDNQLEMKISDTGIGIKDEEQNRIFERFYRVDRSRNRKFGGSGLGLAIVNELIHSIDGKIKVTSQYNVGSSFMFSLPIK